MYKIWLAIQFCPWDFRTCLGHFQLSPCLAPPPLVILSPSAHHATLGSSSTQPSAHHNNPWNPNTSPYLTSSSAVQSSHTHPPPPPTDALIMPVVNFLFSTFSPTLFYCFSLDVFHSLSPSTKLNTTTPAPNHSPHWTSAAAHHKNVCLDTPPPNMALCKGSPSLSPNALAQFAPHLPLVLVTVDALVRNAFSQTYISFPLLQLPCFT